mmetsp:Transcript_77617/g.217821  ORF Transcript_77617/g.217821 Transcript_77617/m.217821 type:complete len:246 (+) Transcript_77617:1053-1790(+)
MGELVRNPPVNLTAVVLAVRTCPTQVCAARGEAVQASRPALRTFAEVVPPDHKDQPQDCAHEDLHDHEFWVPLCNVVLHNGWPRLIIRSHRRLLTVGVCRYFRLLWFGRLLGLSRLLCRMLLGGNVLLSGGRLTELCCHDHLSPPSPKVLLQVLQTVAFRRTIGSDVGRVEVSTSRLVEAARTEPTAEEELDTQRDGRDDSRRGILLTRLCRCACSQSQGRNARAPQLEGVLCRKVVRGCWSSRA